MTSFKLLDQQSRRVFTTVVMLVATIIPALSPVLVSADQVTDRSMTLSSSTVSATGVTYKLDFTPAHAATAIAINFCNDSPLLNATCTAPTGFDVNTGVAAAGWTKDAASTANLLILTGGTISASTDPAITITGVANPTVTGPLYARIATYTTSAGAQGYTATNVDAGATHADDGGIAMDITSNISVNAAVLESMTFCVGGGSTAIGLNCDMTGVGAPTLQLGHSVGGVIALDSASVYSGIIQTQLSTNAASGAVVNLKSNTTGCGGLSRAGAASFSAGCGIPASLAAGLTAGTAGFGLQTGTGASAGAGSSGTLRAYDSGSGAYYNNSTYKLNYVSGDASGVTSTYGDPLLDTNGAPVNNMNMPVTFAATAANNTPAGNYSANLSMIATGKF